MSKLMAAASAAEYLGLPLRKFSRPRAIQVRSTHWSILDNGTPLSRSG
jgi:hypothetical protein